MADDLHGASENSTSLADKQKVDLGLGKGGEYLPTRAYQSLVAMLEKQLGKSVCERNGKDGFQAQNKNRIAAFAHQGLGLNSVQIEMKPSVRVSRRRVDSSMYGKDPSKNGGPYSAPPQNVLGMLQALVEFIEYLKTYKE